MPRIVLIHWNAREARQRAERLRAAGHQVRCHHEQGGESHRRLLAAPPDAFVIDLNRLPSHGRAIGVWLRQQPATRAVPLLFIEGDEAKTRRVKKLLPDAEYCDWRRVRGALRRALAKPPEKPVVPGTMDDYSGTPLVRKLGVKPRASLALLNAPDGFEQLLAPLPDELVVKRRARGRTDLIVLFARSAAELERRFTPAERALAPGGRLWIAWPKKASGIDSDLSQPAVRAFGLDRGLVDFKICSIDATWSALCFSRRRR